MMRASLSSPKGEHRAPRGKTYLIVNDLLVAGEAGDNTPPSCTRTARLCSRPKSYHQFPHSQVQRRTRVWIKLRDRFRGECHGLPLSVRQKRGPRAYKHYATTALRQSLPHYTAVVQYTVVSTVVSYVRSYSCR